MKNYLQIMKNFDLLFYVWNEKNGILEVVFKSRNNI